MFTKSDIERFWSKVDLCSDEDCWEWFGTYSATGYGAFKQGGKQWVASRVAWLLTFGEIPERGYVCHLCDNRRCVNPSHLFMSDAKGNATDMTRKGRHRNQRKTHCGRCGQPFDEANTMPNGEFGRRCRNCHQERARRYYEEHKMDILRRRRVERLMNQRRAQINLLGSGGVE